MPFIVPERYRYSDLSERRQKKDGIAEKQKRFLEKSRKTEQSRTSVVFAQSRALCLSASQSEETRMRRERKDIVAYAVAFILFLKLDE